MKPKTSVHCKSDILGRAIRPACVLLKKKELKRLSSNKKTVRFNLSTHLSTSELLLADSKVVDALKPDEQKDQELTSKSSVNISDPRTALQPVYKRPLACFFDQTGPGRQSIARDISGLRKCFRSFADLYMWEPIISLKKNLPVKGILKNTVCSDRFNTSCRSFMSNANILLAKDSFHDVFETKKQNQQRLPSLSGAWDDCSMLDSLASSVQGLHISAFAPGHIGPSGANVISCERGFTYPPIQPFPTYSPQNQLPEYRRGCVSFFGVEGGGDVYSYDVSHNTI